MSSKVLVSDDDISAFSIRRTEPSSISPSRSTASPEIIITPGRDHQLRNRMDDDAGTPAEAKRKGDVLLGRLRAGGDFAQLAMVSEDPRSLGQGGDLGFVPQSALNQVPPALRNIVMNKEPPVYVSAVTLGDTHALVLVVSKEPAGQRDLRTPAVRDNVRGDTLRDREIGCSARPTWRPRGMTSRSRLLWRQIVENHNKTAVPPLPTTTK